MFFLILRSPGVTLSKLDVFEQVNVPCDVFFLRFYEVFVTLRKKFNHVCPSFSKECLPFTFGIHRIPTMFFSDIELTKFGQNKKEKWVEMEL